MTRGHQLARESAASQGISPQALLAFVDAVDREISSLHSLILLRHGHIVAEGWWSPYAPEIPHMLYSLSKSFTATAIGLAAAEGRLALDDRVLAFFPGEAPTDVGEHLAAMRVRDLLSMSTGHAEDTTGPMVQRADGDWARGFLEQPVDYPPGTHFVYNSGASYMLSVIVQRLVGTTMLDYLRPRLLEPLGIENATWQTCPRGINVGGWGLSITSEAIASFGQLYLQQGIWRGQRLLSADWVAEASKKQVANNGTTADWQQGYGFQFWMCQHGAYRGDGAFGQYCIIMPKQDAVLAITSGVQDMQSVLNLVWERLLPAMQPTPVPDEPAAQAALERRLANLALHPIEGQPTAPTAARISGKTYRFAANLQKLEQLRLDIDEEGATLTVRDERGDHQVKAGAGEWRFSTTTIDEHGVLRSAACGVWTAEDTYALDLCLFETPFRATIVCRFIDDRVLCKYLLNVSFGPTELPEIEGRQA
jgi:CubicO group peptidase (beta-lactamase class C family)